MIRVHGLKSCVAFCCLALASPAMAKAPFFQGKTLNVIINFSSGGPTDTEGRLVARHLAAHIPGNPTIVVRNVTGAGGAIGVNYVGQIAPRDGLTVGYTTGVAFQAAIRQPSLKVDLAKLPLVAAGAGVSVVYIRSDYQGGVKKPSDILKKSDFWVAGLSPDSDKDLRMRMQFDLLGLKYRYLTGYPGTADIRLAILRNEAQVTAESMPSYRASIQPLVAKGEITPLWYDDIASGDASKSPDTEGIPATSYLSFLKAHGKPDTSSILYRSFVIANDIGTQLQRLIVMPPGSPPEAVKDLQNAFAALAHDKAFEQDALKTIRYVPRFAEGPQLEALVQKSLKPDQDVVNFLDKYIAEGEQHRKQ